MITSLNKRQKELLSVYADKWIKIGTCTDPIDKKLCKEAIDQVYKCGSLAPPSIYVFLESPKQGLIANCILSKHKDKVGIRVRAQVLDRVRDQVNAQANAQVRVQVRAQVSDLAYDQVCAQIRSQTYAQVSAQVINQAYAQAYAQVWAQLTGQISNQISYDPVNAQIIKHFGCHDS